MVTQGRDIASNSRVPAWLPSIFAAGHRVSSILDDLAANPALVVHSPLVPPAHFRACPSIGNDLFEQGTVPVHDLSACLSLFSASE